MYNSTALHRSKKNMEKYVEQYHAWGTTHPSSLDGCAGMEKGELLHYRGSWNTLFLHGFGRFFTARKTWQISRRFLSWVGRL